LLVSRGIVIAGGGGGIPFARINKKLEFVEAVIGDILHTTKGRGLPLQPLVAEYVPGSSTQLAIPFVS